MTSPNAISAFPRPGQNDNSGQPDVNLMRVFAGEVLTQFNEKCVMMGLTRSKTVGGGAISYQFPVLGTASSSYHVPGTNILTDDDAAGSKYINQIRASQRIVYADRKMISPTFVDDLDQLLVHWDARAEFSKELGYSLARSVDKNLLSVIIAAAGASATVTGGFGGSEVVDADGDTNAISFADSLFRCKLALDLASVSPEDRYFVMPPAQMKLLMSQNVSNTITWQPLGQVTAGVGGGTPVGAFGADYRAGRVPFLAGFQLVETLHLTQTGTYNPPSGANANRYATTGQNTYQYTVTSGHDIFGVAFHKDAIGTVKLQDVSIEVDRKTEYQGTLVLAKLVMGTGILRPECACVIRKVTGI